MTNQMKKKYNPQSSTMKRPFILFFLLLLLGHARGQEPGTVRGTDPVRVYFRQDESRLDPYFRENGVRIRTFTERFRNLLQDPSLRTSTLHLWYETDKQLAAARDTLYISLPAREPERVRDTVYVPLPTEEDIAVNNTFYNTAPAVPASARVRKPFYMSVKSNLLYDAVAVPNIGVEFYLGRGWSVSGNWMYTWFKNDNRYRYHRVYGGDLELRRWLSYGRKPLTGHHVGLYGQILTYDLEWGGKGYLGDRWSYGGGISYGYSAPIGRRLNLDLTLGVGYLGGEYFEYLPQEGRYVWKATKKRRWFGPTKAEVSLVWLLGHDNVNAKKGGKR